MIFCGWVDLNVTVTFAGNWPNRGKPKERKSDIPLVSVDISKFIFSV